MSIMPRVPLFVAVLYGLCVLLPRIAQSQLLLQEEAAYPLPAGFELSGGQISDHGKVVVWSRLSAATLLWTDTAWTRLCDAQLVVPAAATITPAGLVEILDAETSIVYTASPSQCDAEKRLSSGPVVAASRCKAGWLVLRLLTKNSVQLLADSAQTALLASLGPLFVDRSDAEQTTLECREMTTVIASSRWPFDWGAFDEEGRLTVSGRPPDPIEIDSMFTSAIGLRVVALDSGFAQIVAQFGGARRLLAVYDRAARLRSVSVLSTPIGLLSASRARRELLVLARRGDAADALIMAWSWTPLTRGTHK